MKKRLIPALCALLLMVPALASAEVVSITELREQVEEMGRWTQTYEAHGRTIEVDVPIIVPEVERFPVYTIQRIAPIDRDQFDEIVKKGERRQAPTDPCFVATEESEDTEMGPGMSDSVEYWFGCDYVDGKWVGGSTDVFEHCINMRFFRGETTKVFGRGQYYDSPSSYDYPWNMDMNVPLAEESEKTAADAMAFLQELVRRYRPDQEIELTPRMIDVRGKQRKASLNSGNLSDGVRKDSYEGYYWIEAYQQFGGIPLFKPICDYPINTQMTANASRATSNSAPYSTGAARNRPYIYISYRNEKAYDGSIQVCGVHGVEMEDVPLAPLPDVIAAIETMIESGYIRKVYALRLGYILYSDSETTEYAWAVPSWVLDCVYADSPRAEIKNLHYSNNTPFWNIREFEDIPILAQTAKAVCYGDPTKEAYALPEIITWEEAQ